MPAEWRHFVNDEVQSSDSATYRVELPNRGALHTILLKVQCTNGATAGRGVTILDVVDDIKLIGDGSEVIYSLKPTEVEKWHETLHGKAVQAVQSEAPDAVQEMVFPLMLGRGVYDPEYFLPLERFKDVKLEVTYSPAISATVGFATGTTTFDVMMLISPDNRGLSYAGTLKLRRLNSFTTAASGEQEVELPDALMIRAIGVYAYEAAVADGTDITKIVLEDKASGKKYFEADWDDFIHLNRELYGCEVVHQWHGFFSDTDTLDTRIGEILSYNVETNEDDDIANNTHIIDSVTAIAGDRLTFASSLADLSAGSEDLTAHTTDHDIFVNVRGKSPSHFGLIPFHYQDVRDYYMNTAQLGRPTVILTQGGAGGECNVSIQEVKQY